MAVKDFTVLALPFVADLPVLGKKRSRQTYREFWNIPDQADRDQAWTTGERWAIAFVRSRVSGIGLPWLLRQIAQREAKLPPNSGSTGFSSGFLWRLGELAVYGGKCVPDLDRYQNQIEKHRDELKAQRDKEGHDRIRARVAHMNACRAVKRAGKAVAHG